MISENVYNECHEDVLNALESFGQHYVRVRSFTRNTNLEHDARTVGLTMSLLEERVEGIELYGDGQRKIYCVTGYLERVGGPD